METGLDALNWAAASGAAGNVVRQAEARRRQSVRRRLAAACALLVATGAWFLLPTGDRATGPAALIASAIVHTPETRTLADGSIVELRHGAEIAVEYEIAQRRVVLRSGEAHFRVRKDPARPFVVRAAGVAVRAIGTAFSVDLRRQEVNVLVTEGRVAVAGGAGTASAGAAARPTEAAAGQQVVVPLAAMDRAFVQSPSAEEQRERLGWRTPLLEFSGTPLGEAIGLLNRHGNRRITIEPALSHLKLSGTLRADDTESLLTLLKNEFGITARSATGSGPIELRR
jgi:transmembrane sensor